MLVCVEDLTHRLVLFLYVLYVEAERVRRPTDKVHFTVRLRLRVLHRRSAAGTWNVDTVVVAIISRQRHALEFARSLHRDSLHCAMWNGEKNILVCEMKNYLVDLYFFCNKSKKRITTAFFSHSSVTFLCCNGH